MNMITENERGRLERSKKIRKGRKKLRGSLPSISNGLCRNFAFIKIRDGPDSSFAGYPAILKTGYRIPDISMPVRCSTELLK